jgi:hypothetical protein
VFCAALAEPESAAGGLLGTPEGCSSMKFINRSSAWALQVLDTCLCGLAFASPAGTRRCNGITHVEDRSLDRRLSAAMESGAENFTVSIWVA